MARRIQLLNCQEADRMFGQDSILTLPADAQTAGDLLDYLKNSLNIICERIAEKFGLCDGRGKARRAFIIDVLMRHDCYGCIFKAFTCKQTDSRPDAIYIENHSLAVNMLVEMLRYHLNASGILADVEGEYKSKYGRMDVVIKPTSVGVILESKDKLIIVEVKTGKSFSYPQLFRYMIEKPRAVLIIWRVTKGQIIVLKGEKLQGLLMVYAAVAMHRGLRILKGDKSECNHQLYHNINASIEDPQELVESFLEALSKNLPKVIEVVLSLLDERADLP